MVVMVVKVAHSLDSIVVDSQTKDVMLAKETSFRWLQNKSLTECKWGIIIRLAWKK